MYQGHKPLARPGKKQATATTFCKPLKNNSEGCPSNQVSAAAITSASDEKWRPFNCLLSRVRLRTCRHPCNYHNDIFSSSSVGIWPCTRSQQRDWGKLLSSTLIIPSVAFQMPCTFLTMHNIPCQLLWIRSDIKWQVLSTGHCSGPELQNWPCRSWSRNFSPLWHPNIHYRIHGGLSVYLWVNWIHSTLTCCFLISG